ncbi:ribosome-releasing factor 2, mitochondrial-like [Clavelina lepadiformis]|uniref:ribosome-releasing factor 2, mitochondrial-like n=1 Tax=Clavelina lepadiformis TaxID=159417 RepID=UPI0040438D10
MWNGIRAMVFIPNLHSLKSVQNGILKERLISSWLYSKPYSCKNVRSFGTEQRNIGIMAHIDAGKTTTTERMLYYSGYIKNMGDIDAGTTVMDYLPTEIERGITIQCAAISFNWHKTKINLIDTPGHVDFTMEVERSLRVLDGAVAIFDASRGVEAQSRTVWRQADRYKVPKIAFINKMDKHGANFTASVKSMQEKLNANTLLLQIPVYNDGVFNGVIDLVEMEKLEWDMPETHSNHTGRKYMKHRLKSSEAEWEMCIAARSSLIEQLSEVYDDVAMTWLEGEHEGDASALPAAQIREWIRRGVLDQAIIPVLCGSSLKNVGVQPLLDAVVNYLPNPSDVQHDFMKYYGDSLCAMAFKVLHHKRHGPLIFVRVYSGRIKSGMSIYNPNKSCSEKISRLLDVYADEYKETTTIEAGGIGIICGFKETVTGDTLVSSKESFEIATSKLSSSNIKANDTQKDITTVVLAAVPVPEPVFFCSIAVNTITQEQELAHALAIICREDPSIRVQTDEDGSVTLSGMGKLHMEVITKRIKDEFKIDAYVSPIQVAYREIPTLNAREKGEYNRTILGKDHHVDIDISIEPSEELVPISNVSDIVHRRTEVSHAAAIGIVQACQQGVILGYPLVGAKIRLHSVHASKACPPALVTAAALLYTREVLHHAACHLVEPVMSVEVTTTEDTLHKIIAELNKRHATTHDITAQGTTKFVLAEAPVAEMKGFASTLRSATSGNADLALEIAGYRPVTEERLHKIKFELSGATSTHY